MIVRLFAAYCCACWIYASVDVMRRLAGFRELYRHAAWSRRQASEPVAPFGLVMAIWIVLAPISVPFYVFDPRGGFP